MTNYKKLLREARENLARFDETFKPLEWQRTHLVEIIATYEKLAKGTPDVPTVTPSPEAPPSEEERAGTTSLLDEAVEILRTDGKRRRTIELKKKIEERTGRQFVYSSLSKALDRES